MPRIDCQHLGEMGRQILRIAGVPASEATTVWDHLLQASLSGYDSHGIMRLIQYVREVNEGTIQPGAEWQVIDDWENGAVLDAKQLFGQVACHRAMQWAIEKARRATMAVITLRRTNHSGRLGAYVEQAAAQNMIGLVTANGGGGGQWVAPFGGCQRRLSTNPLAFGAPTGKPFPLVVDISTCMAPEGKVRHYLQSGREVPEGWLVGSDGQSTRDPAQLYATPGAAILPFGQEVGHKAFGLALMVDVLAGALSGAGCPRDLATDHGRNLPDGTGLCLIAIDIGRFLDLPTFISHVGGMVDYIKTSQAAAGFTEIVVPGEFEHRQRIQRESTGIDVPESVWEELCRLASRPA